MKKCLKCKRKVSGSRCGYCNDSDLVDDIIDLGMSAMIGNMIDQGSSNDNSNDSPSSSSDSPSVDYGGGGGFDGGGSGSDF